MFLKRNKLLFRYNSHFVNKYILIANSVANQENE